MPARREGEPLPPPVVDLATVAARKPQKTDTWIHRAQRVHEVVDQISRAIDYGRPDAVGLEDLAYGAKGSAVVILHWLWGEIVHMVQGYEIPLYLVSTSGVKKFATGKGNAPKDQVMLAMAARYPQYPISNNNESDALAVCMATSRRIGLPFDTMPKTHIEALDKVALQ